MRTLVFGDIHNCAKGLKQVLERVNKKSDDILIFLGDYLDGWSEAKEVMEILFELSETNECIFLRGNHDEWVRDFLENGFSVRVRGWLQHGGQVTYDSFNKWFETNPEMKSKVYKFLDSTLKFYQDEQNRVFLHAGFTSNKGIGNEKYVEAYWWDRDLWENAFNHDIHDLEEENEKLKFHKEIYIGHNPTIRYGQDSPINVLNVWNMDTGAAFDGRVSCMDIDKKEIFSSDLVRTLYPNEKGRNQD